MGAAQSGNGTSLAYDAQGRLTYTALNGNITRFAYDGDQIIGEYDGGGNLLRRYIPSLSGDEYVVMYGPNGREYIYGDDRGSVVATAYDSGVSSQILKYDEFGIPGPGQTFRFQFTGQAWLPELGLYHYKARAYSPTLGRFIQPDPQGYGDGMNLYDYVGSDPVNNVDPSGQFAEIVVIGKLGIPLATKAAAGIVSAISSLLGIFSGGPPKVQYKPKEPTKQKQESKPNKKVCYGPPAAPGTGVSRSKLAQIAKRNGNIASKHSRFNLNWFRKQVGTGRPWDFKKVNKAFENFGNYHYGYVGEAQGIQPTILYDAAGIVQVVNGTSNIKWILSRLDDPRDQEMILRGISDRRNGCL